MLNYWNDLKSCQNAWELGFLLQSLCHLSERIGCVVCEIYQPYSSTSLSHVPPFIMRNIGSGLVHHIIVRHCGLSYTLNIKSISYARLWLTSLNRKTAFFITPLIFDITAVGILGVLNYTHTSSDIVNCVIIVTLSFTYI